MLVLMTAHITQKDETVGFDQVTCVLRTPLRTPQVCMSRCCTPLAA